VDRANAFYAKKVGFHPEHGASECAALWTRCATVGSRGVVMTPKSAAGVLPEVRLWPSSRRVRPPHSRGAMGDGAGPAVGGTEVRI